MRPFPNRRRARTMMGTAIAHRPTGDDPTARLASTPALGPRTLKNGGESGPSWHDHLEERQTPTCPDALLSRLSFEENQP